MGSFREYRKAAAECARLAQAAPSQAARTSFAAAAKRWMILARLAGDGSMPAESSAVLASKPTQEGIAVAQH
jgi:hypothetical protein